MTLENVKNGICRDVNFQNQKCVRIYPDFGALKTCPLFARVFGLALINLWHHGH